MIWNEPDLGGQDNIAPTLGAQYFKQISDTILTADPTARLIVGNVGVEYPPTPTIDCQGTGCGVYWLTQFITAYTATYGIDPRLAIAGYGIHAYSMGDKRGLGLTNCTTIYSSASDPCLLTAFTSTVQIGTQWLADNDPGKELWLTEVNWEYGPQPNRDTWTLQISRSIQICSSLSTHVANGDIQRYSWWYGGHPYSSSVINVITPSLYLADISGSSVVYTGTLSPGGQQFISC